MDSRTEAEIYRLTANAARHRAQLRGTASRLSIRRTRLSLLAGLLSLTSAASIVSVINGWFGDYGMQIFAAATTAASGCISLVLPACMSEREIYTRYAGSSKYLALRESVYRLIGTPSLTDAARWEKLTELQLEYHRLDEQYGAFIDATHDAKSHEDSAPCPLSKSAPEPSDVVLQVEEDLELLRNAIETAQLEKEHWEAMRKIALEEDERRGI